MTILYFPKHKIVSPPDMPELGGCEICGGWEGELPTDCPGITMTLEQRQAVMVGKLDYLWSEGWTTVTHVQRLKINLSWEGRTL
jgi:hypothetical protein